MFEGTDSVFNTCSVFNTLTQCLTLFLQTFLRRFLFITETSDRVKAAFKPVTDEQVFYDKFLYGKFYLPSARVYVRQILYDKFLVF